MFSQCKMDDQFTEWHSVRPWNPTLSLAVREITSVSVTFILSCPYSSTDAGNEDPPSVTQPPSDDEDESRDSGSTTDTGGPAQVVADILAKGLSVKVNGTPWQRVFLKMDELFDEGIIILYGLMPARQYDIELGLSPGQTNASVRGQITTGAYLSFLCAARWSGIKLEVCGLAVQSTLWAYLEEHRSLLSLRVPISAISPRSFPELLIDAKLRRWIDIGSSGCSTALQ